MMALKTKTSIYKKTQTYWKVGELLFADLHVCMYVCNWETRTLLLFLSFKMQKLDQSGFSLSHKPKTKYLVAC